MRWSTSTSVCLADPHLGRWLWPASGSLICVGAVAAAALIESVATAQYPDIDLSNNTKPLPAAPTLFKIYKSHRQEEKPNPMQRAKAKP